MAEAKSFQETTEKFSAGVLATKEAELQAGVDAATEAKRVCVKWKRGDDNTERNRGCVFVFR